MPRIHPPNFPFPERQSGVTLGSEAVSHLAPAGVGQPPPQTPRRACPGDGFHLGLRMLCSTVAYV